MIERIVSGGQRGIDRAALDFALERIIAHLGEANVKVFYVKTPVEFGVLGDESACRRDETRRPRASQHRPLGPSIVPSAVRTPP